LLSCSVLYVFYLLAFYISDQTDDLIWLWSDSSLGDHGAKTGMCDIGIKNW